MRRFFFALCAAVLPGSALACPAYDQAAAAYAQPDPQIRVQILRQLAAPLIQPGATPPQGCPQLEVDQINRWASLALYKSYQQTGRLEEIAEAGRYSAYWAAQEAHGDHLLRLGHQARDGGRAAEAGRNYEAAGGAYVKALRDIDDLTAREPTGVHFGDAPPSPEIRRNVLAKIEDLQQVLGRMLDSRVNCRFEDIAPGAGMAPAVFPITFEFDSDRMNSEGLKTAQVLYDCLSQLPPGTGEVAVIGHADPQGDDGYNCRLSTRRAQAVVDHLRAMGVSLPLRAVGRGEEEPYRPQGANFNQQQIYAMSRRVEADVPGPGQSTTWRRSCVP